MISTLQINWGNKPLVQFLLSWLDRVQDAGHLPRSGQRGTQNWLGPRSLDAVAVAGRQETLVDDVGGRLGVPQVVATTAERAVRLRRIASIRWLLVDTFFSLYLAEGLDDGIQIGRDPKWTNCGRGDVTEGVWTAQDVLLDVAQRVVQELLQRIRRARARCDQEPVAVLKRRPKNLPLLNRATAELPGDDDSGELEQPRSFSSLKQSRARLAVKACESTLNFWHRPLKIGLIWDATATRKGRRSYL